MRNAAYGKPLPRPFSQSADGPGMLLGHRRGRVSIIYLVLGDFLGLAVFDE